MFMKHPPYGRTKDDAEALYSRCWPSPADTRRTTGLSKTVPQ